MRGQQGRRWDETLQRECLRHQAAAGLPADDWTTVVEDRDAWSAHEPTFLISLLRRCAIEHRRRRENLKMGACASIEQKPDG